MPSAEVLLEHAAFLRRLARGILHDADAADDVAQDAIVAALGERPKNLRAWLG
ncbi:MAG TPA: sigma factor, partial [Planctomycetota bacterium]|nr:sigma factor [Planctomycetota bacterium]